MSLSVYPRGYLRNRTRDLHQFLCVLPMSVARFSSGMLTIGRIAFRQEGGDGSAQIERSVIHDCPVLTVVLGWIGLSQTVSLRSLCCKSLLANCTIYGE